MALCILDFNDNITKFWNHNLGKIGDFGIVHIKIIFVKMILFSHFKNSVVGLEIAQRTEIHS